MATRTSSQTGDWNQSSTWGGSTPPGDGDDAIISSGHVVTVTANQTVGTSGATGTRAILLTGTLTVSGGVLSVRGDIQLDQGGILNVSRESSNTGGLTFDPPGGSTYEIIATLGGSGTAQFNVTGESGDRVPITTSARGGGNFFMRFQNHAPNMAWSWVEVTNCGSTGNTSTTRALTLDTLATSSFTFANVRFKSIGKWFFNMNGVSAPTATLDLSSCDWRTPLNTDGEWMEIQWSSAKSGGTRRFLNCTFHHTALSPILLFARDFTVDGGVYSNSPIVSDIFDRGNTLQNSFYVFNVAVNGMVGGQANVDTVVQDNAFYVDQTTSDNPHYCVFTSDSGLGLQVVLRRNVVDGNGVPGSDTGDFAISGGSMLVQQNIMFNKAGVLAAGAFAGSRYTIRRNTCSNAGASTSAGETTGDDEQLVEMTSNLFQDDEHGLHQDTAFVSQSNFTLNNNGFWNMTLASNLDHPTLLQNSYVAQQAFANWWTSGAYGDANKGQNDIYGDPTFVDDTRTAVSWYNSIFGSGGSFTNVRAELLKLNGTDASGSDASFTAGVTASAFATYIRAGFRPTNTIYKATGVGGVDVGAVDFQTGTNFNLTRP